MQTAQHAEARRNEVPTFFVTCCAHNHQRALTAQVYDVLGAEIVHCCGEGVKRAQERVDSVEDHVNQKRERSLVPTTRMVVTHPFTQELFVTEYRLLRNCCAVQVRACVSVQVCVQVRAGVFEVRGSCVCAGVELLCACALLCAAAVQVRACVQVRVQLCAGACAAVCRCVLRCVCCCVCMCACAGAYAAVCACACLCCCADTGVCACFLTACPRQERYHRACLKCLLPPDDLLTAAPHTCPPIERAQPNP